MLGHKQILPDIGIHGGSKMNSLRKILIALKVWFRNTINWFFPPNEVFNEVEYQPHYSPEVNKSWFHTTQKQSPILKGRKWTYVIRDIHTNAIVYEIFASRIKDVYHKIRKIHKYYYPTDTLILIGYHTPKVVI